jgi:hypothetical protein
MSQLECDWTPQHVKGTDCVHRLVPPEYLLTNPSLLYCTGTMKMSTVPFTQFQFAFFNPDITTKNVHKRLTCTPFPLLLPPLPLLSGVDATTNISFLNTSPLLVSILYLVRLSCPTTGTSAHGRPLSP